MLATTLLAASILVQSAPPAAVGDSALTASLLKIEQSLWQAWKARDTTYYLNALLPHAVYVSGGGVASRSRTIQQVVQFRCVVDSTLLDHPQSLSLGPDQAVLMVHAVVDYHCGDTAKRAAAWSSTVFSRRGKDWKIIFHQESTSP